MFSILCLQFLRPIWRPGFRMTQNSRDVASTLSTKCLKMQFLHLLMGTSPYNTRVVLKMQGLSFLEARFQIFTQNCLLGNIKYFVSFKLKSLKSNVFGQNSTLYPNTDHLTVNIWQFRLIFNARN